MALVLFIMIHDNWVVIERHATEAKRLADIGVELEYSPSLFDRHVLIPLGMAHRDTVGSWAFPIVTGMNCVTTENVGSKELAGFGNLRWLLHLNLSRSDVENPQLAVVDDAIASDLSSLSSLISIDLSHTSITDKSLLSISQLKRIEMIYLCNTNITWKGICSLKSCETIIVLWIDGVPLTNDLVRELVGWKSLATLRIGASKIAPDVAKQLSQSPSLKEVTVLKDVYSPAEISSLKESLGKVSLVIDSY